MPPGNRLPLPPPKKISWSFPQTFLRSGGQIKHLFGPHYDLAVTAAVGVELSRKRSLSVHTGSFRTIFVSPCRRRKGLCLFLFWSSVETQIPAHELCRMMGIQHGRKVRFDKTNKPCALRCGHLSVCFPAKFFVLNLAFVDRTWSASSNIMPSTSFYQKCESGKTVAKCLPQFVSAATIVKFVQVNGVELAGRGSPFC